jgi:hypothetical protein
MGHEYIIYCDESEDRGQYFSDFYGGALVCGEHMAEVVQRIRAKKQELNLHREVKWQRVTEQYEAKYVALMDTFFQLIQEGKIKVRIMFTQNMFVAKGLTKRHVDDKYFILYYQFIKHAFGLHCSPVYEGGVQLKVYPDKIPDTNEKIARFRSYIVALAKLPAWRERDIKIHPDNVTDVLSHEHEVLQCLDVVLGAVHFKLNNKHRALTARNNTRRGSRTKAKARLFKHIQAKIEQVMYPRFNVGITTGRRTDDCFWRDPYRHWVFMPRERIVIPELKKKKR